MSKHNISKLEAALLEEWDDTWNSGEMPEPSVNARQDNKFVNWPQWLLNYRRPEKEMIKQLRR